jgi:hypothetical protein
MCDTLVALAPATVGGATLFAKNSDRPPDEVQHLLWSPPRRDTTAVRVTHIEVEPHHLDTVGCVVSVPSWCWGAEHGVNDAGVAIGNEAIYTTLDPRSQPPALIGMDLVRLGLERATTATDAVSVITDLLERYGQGGTGHDPAGHGGPKAYWSSFLVADPHEAYVVETSGRTWAGERVERSRAISNRTTIAAFDAEHRHPRQPVELFVDPRWHASQAVLAAEPVDRAALERHLRSHDSCAVEGWAVCMHAVDDAGEPVEDTTASIIAELPQGAAPSIWVAPGHPCRHPYRNWRLSGRGAPPPGWPSSP